MNKTILILINGHAGVGKDTFVDLCRQFAVKRDCEVMNLHRSDAPKAALTSLGWDGAKDEETRTLLKNIIDWMEPRGLLNMYLNNQIEAAESVFADKDLLMFYHVRDPEVMYSLMEMYVHHKNIKPVSVLIQRNIAQPKEPNDWWGDLENADYMMSLRLPENNMKITQEIAEEFVDFMLKGDWEVVMRKEIESWQKQ